jgi:hypothetical protein
MTQETDDDYISPTHEHKLTSRNTCRMLNGQTRKEDFCEYSIHVKQKDNYQVYTPKKLTQHNNLTMGNISATLQTLYLDQAILQSQPKPERTSYW